MWKTADELFLILDDRGGGPHQAFKRKVKFKLRQMWFKTQLTQLRDYLSEKHLDDLLQIDPALYLKCTRSYLRAELNGRERAKAQLAFYDWFLSIASAEQICQFYKNKQVTVAQIEAKDKVFEIQLKPAGGLGREGELAAFFYLDGEMLIKTAFTILPATLLNQPGHGKYMYIGGFQGARNALERFKEATQILERVKPAHVFFNVLQSLAQAWGLDGILATSDNTHAYANYKTTLAKRVKTSYDHTWTELGASTQTPDGLWILPTTWTARPESEIESKKRAAYRRRNALRQHFMDTSKQGMLSLF